MFVEKYPELGKAHEAIAEAVDAAGPLNAKTLLNHQNRIERRRGTLVGNQISCPPCAEAWCDAAGDRAGDSLPMNTCGFPRTAAAWSWTLEQFDRKD